MARKSVSSWVRFGFAAAPWVVSVWLAERALGADIGRAGHDAEERIELQLKGGIGSPQPVEQPERSHEDSIEPWELVGV
jgi:hypothetical protein